MISKTKYDLDKLTNTLNNIGRELKTIDEDEKIKQYGTFFDSKYEVLQLYVLFMFFGVHIDIINQLPDLNKRNVYKNEGYLNFPDVD